MDGAQREKRLKCHVEGKRQNLGPGDPAAGKNVFQHGSALIGSDSPDPLFILDPGALMRRSSQQIGVPEMEEAVKAAIS